MTQNRFSSLAQLYIHRNVTHDIEKIIDEFARMKPRKMQICNILDSDEQ